MAQLTTKSSRPAPAISLATLDCSMIPGSIIALSTGMSLCREILKPAPVERSGDHLQLSVVMTSDAQ